MNKRIFFLAFWISITYPGIGQENGSHLEPVNGIFCIYDFQFEYYSRVRTILFEGLSDTPEIRFQVMASFSTERVLDIEYDRDNKKYYLIYHECRKALWDNEDWDKVKVSKSKKEIDLQSVELIKSLFMAAISTTRFPDEEVMGLDGTNYYFTASSFGQKTGTIWSPPETSKMGRLVEIGYGLIKHTKSLGLSGQLSKELQATIEKLKKELE